MIFTKPSIPPQHKNCDESSSREFILYNSKYDPFCNRNSIDLSFLEIVRVHRASRESVLRTIMPRKNGKYVCEFCITYVNHSKS